MPRYTVFENLEQEAWHCGERYERVWLRDPSKWLKVKNNDNFPTEYYLNGIEISREEARDLFNLEMRVFGWVSTERTN